MNQWVAYALITFVATLAAVVTYQWIRAEIDERRWRRMIDEELSDPVFMYRLVRDDGSDRE